MTYVDGMIAPVFPGRKEDYLAFARETAQLFLDHGALQIVETYGDADVHEGKRTDLWRAVAADRAAGEGIVFSWIVWPSKEARDAGWAAIEKDGRMTRPADMPFDAGRMIYGGFDLLFDSRQG